MSDINIGTKGWSAIIAGEFTIANLKRAAQGTAEWMQKQNFNKVIIGFDCRFGGKMFSRKVAKIMAAKDFEVYVCEKFISTAMLANGVLAEKADLGIFITAGTRPYFFSGYKLISNLGDELVHDIEQYIPETPTVEYESVKEYKAQGKIKVLDLEEIYFQRLIGHFDIAKIRAANLRVVVDAMHGSAQMIWKRLLPESLQLRSEYNPSFNDTVPHPTPYNLTLLSQLVASTDYTHMGVGFGGAAENLCICDETGKFVDVEVLKSKIIELEDMKDSVWIAMTLLQLMAETGKKLSEL